MNYYAARELTSKDGSSTGLWHYTRMNDHVIWPTGYCAQGCAGHDTAEEAEDHQRQYWLDTASYTSKLDRTQERCEYPSCGEWTQYIARYGEGKMSMKILCERHCNRDGLDAVLEFPGFITSSY